MTNIIATCGPTEYILTNSNLLDCAGKQNSLFHLNGYKSFIGSENDGKLGLGVLDQNNKVVVIKGIVLKLIDGKTQKSEEDILMFWDRPSNPGYLIKMWSAMQYLAYAQCLEKIIIPSCYSLISNPNFSINTEFVFGNQPLDNIKKQIKRIPEREELLSMISLVKEHKIAVDKQEIENMLVKLDLTMDCLNGIIQIKPTNKKTTFPHAKNFKVCGPCDNKRKSPYRIKFGP